MAGAVGGRIAGRRYTPRAIVIRVLGAPQVIQGTAQIAYPTTDLLLAGVASDAVHAANTVALAMLWPRYRRPDAASAAAAGLSAAAGAAILMVDRE